MPLQGGRKQEKVTDPVPWKAASAVPAEIEVGKQGFVNPNSRDGHRPTIKGKAWSGPRTQKGGSPAGGDGSAGSAWQDGDDEAVTRRRRRRTKSGETPRVDVAFLLRPKGWEGFRTEGVRWRCGINGVDEEVTSARAGSGGTLSAWPNARQERE